MLNLLIYCKDCSGWLRTKDEPSPAVCHEAGKGKDGVIDFCQVWFLSVNLWLPFSFIFPITSTLPTSQESLFVTFPS